MPWKYTNATDFKNAMAATHMSPDPPPADLMAEYDALIKYAGASGNMQGMQTLGDSQAFFNRFLQDVPPPGSNFWDGTFLIAGQKIPKIAAFGAAAALLLLLLAKN